MRSVVITGMGIVSDLGNTPQVITNNLSRASDAITMVDVQVSKDRIVQYPVHMIDRESVAKDMSKLPYELERTFTPMSLFAYKAARFALSQAKLSDKAQSHYYQPEKIGLAVASGLPSIGTFEDLFLHTMAENPKNMPTGDIFKTLNNSVAFNLGHALGIKGRVLSPTSACASSLQSIILGYEAIRNGYADMMICGGAEEYHPYLSFIFNKLGIASKTSCKPFQKDRDGIIVGEGAGIVILESEDMARNRGAEIIAEVMSGGMSFSNSAAYSDTDSILQCMLQATQRARIEYIDAINAHATGTPTGDAQEADAIRQYLELYPNTVMKTTALKGFFGHTMAACGAIELIMSIHLAKAKRQMPVCSAEQISDDCKDALVYTGGDTSVYPFLLVNSFGLGGVNTSILVNMR